MKIKIISEGYGHNTKVINQETGEELEGIESIEWSVFPGQLAVCELRIHDVPIELTVERIKKHKLSNKI